VIGEEGTFLVFTPSDAAERRLKHLACLETQGQLTFPDVLERACIRDHLDQKEAAQADFQWCFKHFDEAEIEYILALAHCVSSEPYFHYFYAPVQRKMAASHCIKRLLRIYKENKLPEELFRQYLELLPLDSNFPLSAETCELLLGINHERLRYYAAEQLIRHHHHSSGAHAVIEWVKAGQLPDEDALSLLENDLDLVTKVMREEIPHPVVVRLFEKLAKRHSGRIPIIGVKAGCWVRCIAGWGRIEKIETAEGKEIINFVDRKDLRKLQVLLRAQAPLKAELVTIDLNHNTVIFPRAQKLFTCKKCEHFSSAHQSHIHYHNREAHKGTGCQMSITQEATLQQREALEFVFSQAPGREN